MFITVTYTHKGRNNDTEKENSGSKIVYQTHCNFVFFVLLKKKIGYWFFLLFFFFFVLLVVDSGLMC